METGNARMLRQMDKERAEINPLVLQAVSFEPGEIRGLFMVQAERLSCAAFASAASLTIVGSKFQLREVIDRLIEHKIEFTRSFQPSARLMAVKLDMTMNRWASEDLGHKARRAPDSMQSV